MAAPLSARPHFRSIAGLLPVLPGLGITIGLALSALLLQRVIGIQGLSPLVLAMLMGMGLRNGIGPLPGAAPGIAFVLRRILRLAIVLLGFQLTFPQLLALGPGGLATVALTLAATFTFTKGMARILGVERRLGELIAAGTSVCGASAVMACNTVTRGSDEDVAYAIACVTVFGSLSMVLYPLIGAAVQMPPESYGLWAGSTIHEVAQVVGAGFARGEIAGHTATVAKLGRVILLAPLILALARLGPDARTRSGARAPVPWFVFGFLAVVLLNSHIDLPASASHAIALTTSFMMTMALAAMGLETDIRKLRMKGLRPLALGAIAWGFISCTGLGLVALT